MSSGVTCQVYLDGARFADGCTGEPATAPAALSGLSITWGRETTVDQPDASTCAFEVLDPVGGTRFTDLLRTGVRVDVTATGTIFPGPTAPVWPDPGFETGTANTIRTNTTATVTGRHPFTGTRSLALTATKPANRATAILAPAPFVPAGTDPAAWDAIPATAPGQTWRVGATVAPPPGAVVQISPVLFTGPWTHAAIVLAPIATVTGNGAWHTVAADVVPELDGAWVGIRVSTWPTGPTWDTVDPTLTWDGAAPAWTWDDYATTWVDDVTVLAPAAGTVRSVLVFSGRVVGLTQSWPDGDVAPVVQVAAVDFTADLQNRQIGDDPWLVETVAARFARVLDLAGADVDADLDPDLGAYLVTWRDVDAQAATGLLVELAESVDGVLWSATHATTGPYFVLEDPTKRPALYVLDDVDGIVTIVPGTGRGVAIDACDVLRDQVVWVQDVSDVITRTAVTWQQQGVDTEGKPTTTERTVQRVDAALEAAHGTRRLALSTQLQSATDAGIVADRIMTRTTTLDWRATGLALDDDDLTGDADTVGLLLGLLDGTARNGAGLQLVGLPSWAPAPEVGVNLEGGKYSFEDGRWVLDLTVSNYAGQGASAAWDDLDPAWTWNQMDPALSWDDLRGIGVAEAGA